MLAVIKALQCLKEPCILDIYSDSAYVVNAFLNDWISSWEQKGWKNSAKEPVKNIDLWQELLGLCKNHQISWHKVKGHSTDVYNNRCDALARGEVDKYLNSLK